MSQSTKSNNIELPGGWQVKTLINEVPDNAISVRQIHGNKIITAQNVIVGSSEADGLFINDRALSAAIHTADCLPLVLTTKNSALILHVSRKSLIKGLLDEVDNFINPKEIIGAYLGPHICIDHFTFAEAGDEIKKFREMFPEAVEVRENIFHLSLRKAVERYLKQWGVEGEKIQENSRCTFEDKELPSYKRRLGTKVALCWMVTVVEKSRH